MLLGHVINESAGPDKPTKRRQESVPKQDDSETTGVLKDKSHDEGDISDDFDLPMDEGNWGLNWKKSFLTRSGRRNFDCSALLQNRTLNFLSQFRDEFLTRGYLPGP